jgi:hypothetical protein
LKHLVQIKTCLEGIGYQAALFSDAVGLWTGEGRAALVAHSRLPKDLRTAAFAVYDGRLGTPDAFATVRATGAALAIGIAEDTWQTCRIGHDGLHVLGHGDMRGLDRFLKQHTSGFRPDAVYRAKVWGRLDPEARQLDFVDSGLMPMVEKDMGDRLSKLLEECVHDLADDLGWANLGDTRADEKKAEWLIQAPFWLLAAKTLRDKRVARFTRLDLGNFDDVFARLAKHYGSDEARAIQVPRVRLGPLSRAADRIDRFASLELLSAEALGHIYESTLINKATRKKLGTHSTPPWLIDYILGKLRPWIAEMPPQQRVVFEPACGHAGFLVAALRLLDELRPDDFPESRNTYLRKRLHGVDVDAFSQEIARLALTLADVPNPNGWNLINEDMFASDIIERQTRAAHIVLLNPPFEGFGEAGQKGWLPNKAAETLRRIVENLPPGGVIGFVGPQGILQNKQAKAIRRGLLEHYEIQEVLLFADKVFEFGEPESTVILARKHAAKCARGVKSIPFIRVREGDVENFSRVQEADPPETARVSDLLADDDCPLFVPQLAEVWQHLRQRGLPHVGTVALTGQGLSHNVSGRYAMESPDPFPYGVPGFAEWRENQRTHELPKAVFLNLNPSSILRTRHGMKVGTAQILLNYAPVSRGPWRLKALLDAQGHPVTSRFIVIRPLDEAYSLPVLWALFNSPLANAFAFCHLSKRDNLVGRLRTLPVPALDRAAAKPLEAAASAYLKSACRWSDAAASADDAVLPLFRHAAGKKSKAAAPNKEDLRILHLRVDAEVMRLYGLPPEMERRVLDVFAGEPRKGVPFEQTGYFPKDLEGLNTVADLVTVLADWEPRATRKSELIQKKVARTATKPELAELADLKRLSAARRNLLAPLPMEEARRMYDEVVRRIASSGSK